jgi:hypothetical protein
MLLTNVRRALYRQQPKSADLLMGFVSFLLALSAFITRNIDTDSPVILALEKVAPIEVWVALLFVYAICVFVGTALNHSLLTVVASGLGTFSWGAICGTLIFNLPLEPRLLVNISIYIVFFWFAAWSFISAQEVHRLTKQFGPNYHRVVEEDMLKEIVALRERVASATLTHDEYESDKATPDVK